MAYDNELRNDLLKAADVVDVVSSYLSLQKKGKDYIALCPFHDDSNPSMHVSKEKQMFKCFVCGTGGDAISFVSKYRRISYGEAMREVAKLVGFTDPRLESNSKPRQIDERKERLIKCARDLATYYQYCLSSEEGEKGYQYFIDRHLDDNMQKKYLLGYAPNDGVATIEFLKGRGHSLKTIEDIGIASINSMGMSDNNRGRVIFPICDSNGDVVGFSARRIENNGEAKYINSPETYLFHKSNILYNYHIAKEKAKQLGYIYVLEGFMDVFALSRIGLDNAVALMGVELSSEHIAMLRNLNVEIRLCLDGDLAGQKGMMKIANKLQEEGLRFVIVDNQKSKKDPDEILNEDGEEALNAYLKRTLSRIDFALNYYLNSNPLNSIDQKKKLIMEFIPILINVKSQLELDTYLRKLSSITGFEVESIRELVKNYRYKDVTREDVQKEMQRSFRPERKLLRRLELAERELLYQMIHNPEAAKFYQDNVKGFYVDIYRKVANYIVNYADIDNNYNASELLAYTQMQAEESGDGDEIANEITSLCFENNHPDVCDDELLNTLLRSIMDERNRINEVDMLEQSMEGKDELTKARILAEYNRRKFKK